MGRKKQSDQQFLLFQPTMVQTAYGAVDAPVRVFAHRSDPVTSHMAAQRVSRSERAALHRQIALQIVQTHPGHTGMELWSLAAQEQQTELGDHHELYRKLSDVRHLGLLRQGDARLCTVKHVSMVTWWPVEAAT